MQEIDWNEQWEPRIYFFNLVRKDKIQTSHEIIKPDDGGANTSNSVPDVKMGIRMKATFKCDMDLRDFPFDCQPLTIKLMSDWTSLQVKFVKDRSEKDSIRIDTFTGKHEWSLHKHVNAKPEKEKKEQTGSPREYPMYHLTTHVERKSAYYLWNVALIVLLIVVLSFTSFAVSPDEPANRLGVTLTLLLTAVAFKFVVSQSLPTISYLTILDKYVLLGLVIQCLMVGQNALASIFSSEQDAALFDHISLRVFAVIIIFAQIVFIIVAIYKKRSAGNELERKTANYEKLCEEIKQENPKKQEEAATEEEKPQPVTNGEPKEEPDNSQSDTGLLSGV
ncbi:acetylcholine receptor subunit alpha-type acr-7-like [Amphiura filiformis]|uniref:acetylcholine receptor subunit alpha-type acr-7-like n=1 Tax=Amphiura filiformis TaxID=82378 RepID=UPI003B219E6E